MDSGNDQYHNYEQDQVFLTGGDAYSLGDQQIYADTGMNLCEYPTVLPVVEAQSPRSYVSEDWTSQGTVSPIDSSYQNTAHSFGFSSHPSEQMHQWDASTHYHENVESHFDQRCGEDADAIDIPQGMVDHSMASDMIIEYANPSQFHDDNICAVDPRPQISSDMCIYNIFKLIPAVFKDDPSHGPFIDQFVYKPSTQTDRKRYIADVDLQRQPLYFFWSSLRGYPLDIAQSEKGKKASFLHESNVPVLEHCGPSISVRIMWPGYEPYSAQISTRNYREIRGPITLLKLAYEISKVVGKFFKHHEGKQIDPYEDSRWDLRRFRTEDLVLVSLHQISKGSWQPHLRLRDSLDSYSLKNIEVDRAT